MRVRLFNDLYLVGCNYVTALESVDVVVLAGDIRLLQSEEVVRGEGSK